MTENVLDLSDPKAPRVERQRQVDERGRLITEMRAVLDKAKKETRELTDEERTTLDTDDAALISLDTDIARLDTDIERAERMEARERESAMASAGNGSGGSRIEVGAEPRTYSHEAEHQGVRFLRDLMRAQRGDPSARDRLQRHMQEARDHELKGYETRDVGTGAFAGLTVPQYLTDLVAPLARAGRPVLDICNRRPLPPDGMTVNISRITTGTAVAVQATENAAVQETNADDTLLTVNVNTYAGMQDVSRQAIDRGTGIDDVVIADLVRAYNTTVDSAVLNADGTGGTHLGIRSTTGIIAVTYTDATPTAAEAWPKLWDLVQQIQAGVFSGVTHFIMHPRRFWWFVSQVGTSFPFIHVDSPLVTVQAGDVSTLAYEEGPSGRLGPVPVIVDANIPTNLGTNEDVIIGVDARNLFFWEEANSPLLIRTEEALSNQLSVRFVVYSYSAFSAGRYPGASGTITGTGLILPVF